MAANSLILETKADLLRYFNAANFGALERQFNADGRLAPVMLDFDGPRVMIATAPHAPEGRIRVLDRFGVASLGGMQEKISAGLVKGSQQIATQALNIGQSTFEFIVNAAIMLYLLFFLFRDGGTLSQRIKSAIPLRAELRDALLEKFTVVIRATVKGSILVAMAQGALGGLIFWILDIQGALLWSVVMALLSLIPAVGAALIWAPVAIYFLVSGAIWQGISLILYGLLVIGLVDNVLRPILVGKDTRMSDYVVLFSYSHSGNTMRRWINTITAASGSMTFNATTSGASAALTLGASGGGASKVQSGTRIYAFAMGNTYIGDTEAAAIFGEYEARHGRDYTP